MSARFVSTIEPERVAIGLQSRRLLSWNAIPPSSWPDVEGDTRVASAFLLGLRNDGDATFDGDRLVVSHETASRLPHAVADIIGLPPIAPLSVTLSFEGRVEEPDSSIRPRWYDATSRAVRVSRDGLRLQWGNETGRLSHALFVLVEAIDAFNDTRGQSIEERISAWRPVQEALRRTTGSDIRPDVYLNSLTIYQAGSFALDVRETGRGPDFVPVLMSRSKAATLEDNAPVDETDGDGTDEPPVSVRDQVADALLSPELQTAFEQNYCTLRSQPRDAYVLSRNTYLVVDPDLKLALGVVRAKRIGTVDERRAFLRNPRPAIAEVLTQAGRETPAVCLFVETAQYSERVLGLGAWDPPKLPWLKKRAGQWLPESFPFKIADRSITLTPEGLYDLQNKYVSANLECMPVVEVQGETHRTEEIGKALREFEPERAGEEPAQPADSDELPSAQETQESAPEGPATPLDDGQVLQIKTNIEGVEYQIEHARRPVRIPKDLPGDRLSATVPKPHQVDGFDWLVEAWSSGWPGVLLADDMGLGKTFQALAFLAWLRKNRQAHGAAQSTGPIIIVAPTALLRNWTAEAKKHLAPNALGECVEAFGYGLSRLKRPKTPDWTPEDALDVILLRKADWILTTYETLADNHRAFARVAFSLAVFDEMQKIKAPGTINTHAAKALNADFVLGITGTPIENRIEDIWCIMDRVAPGYLGDLKSFSRTHGEEDPNSLSKLKAKLDEPLGKAPPIMLRRMKETILEGLPPKSTKKYRVEMPAVQAEAYAKAVASASSGRRDGHSMLKAIHAFRGISLHPEGGEGVDPYDRPSISNWVSRSARLSKVFEILRAIRDASEKAIVFVEDRKIQEAFASAVTLHFDLPVRPATINGAIPGAKRQAIVDQFQSSDADFGILVLSPKAAGIGLTITAANHVIHLSRWWNPAVEDQCNDRVYRIGQDRPVTIHLPMAVHPVLGQTSFDETLDSMLENKRSLSRQMLVPPVRDGDISTLFEASVGS